MNHLLLMGVDLNYESFSSKVTTRNGTCNNVPMVAGSVGCTPAAFTVNAVTPVGSPPIPGNYGWAQAMGAGLYFNDTITVVPQLKLVGGLRWDVYSAQIGNSLNYANTAGSTTTPWLNQTDYFTSVRAGAIYEPTPEQSYYVSYSTSFNPSLEQLTSTTGSMNLPPESNQGYEAGVKYQLLNGNLGVNGAIFQITKSNARTANADGTFTPTGTVRVQGIRTGIAGRITPEWQVFGGYAYLNARIINGITNTANGAVGTTTGNVPLNTPTNSANLWTTYTFNQTWEVGGGVFYVGQRYANNPNTVQVPGYTRVDLTAAYVQPKYDIRFNIFNLFDTMYYDSLMASDGGRAVAGTGLTGMISLNYRL